MLCGVCLTSVQAPQYQNFKDRYRLLSDSRVRVTSVFRALTPRSHHLPDFEPGSRDGCAHLCQFSFQMYSIHYHIRFEVGPQEHNVESVVAQRSRLPWSHAESGAISEPLPCRVIPHTRKLSEQLRHDLMCQMVRTICRDCVFTLWASWCMAGRSSTLQVSLIQDQYPRKLFQCRSAMLLVAGCGGSLIFEHDQSCRIVKDTFAKIQAHQALCER